MKKIISYILLLAMCVTLFAGCADNQPATEPTTPTESALTSAKDYLYAMYKEAKATTDADYTVVSQVRVDGVVYPITWSSDKAENVSFVAGDNNMTTVKITASAEDVNYKLTATLTNDKGEEVSVSFDRIIPAKAQVGGKTIVLAYPKENKFITGSHYLYTGKNKWQLNLTENEADAIALEVIENSDGTVTFKAGDQYLFCDATHVKFVAAQDDNTKFVLEAADTEGGYFIRCAVANYNGKAQYLEVYSGYLTSYGMGSDPSIYVFKLQESTVAAGTISGLEETPAPTDPAPTTPAATDPAPTTPAPTTPANPSDPKPTTPAPTEPKPTTPANPSTPSSDKVVLSYPKENKYVTGSHSLYAAKNKWQLNLSDKKADAIALEKITNSDGTVSFKAGNQYLLADATHVMFTATQSDNTKFVLEAADGGYYIKLAYATYYDKAQYLEIYSGVLTSYGMGTDPSIYVFKLEDATGANGTISGYDANAGSNNSGNSGNSGTNNNTGTSVTINGKKAATLDMQGTTTRTSYSTSQTVHSANGITYTNDKASSTTNNYDQTKSYAARAYKSSTIKIDYTGMVAIVFHMDDYSPEAGKDYMSGFDSMTVEGATITRNGADVTITFASPVNSFQSAELGSQVRILSIDVYTK